MAAVRLAKRPIPSTRVKTYMNAPARNNCETVNQP